jgi:Glutathione S-transferase, N-terminal domain
MHPGKILENASGLFVCAEKVRRKKVMLDHPIFTRWPAQDPDRLQLFSAATPNGVKVGIMLEETGLAYEPHRIDIMADESHDAAFLALNPNGKIPAIYDPNGPSGTPLALFEIGCDPPLSCRQDGTIYLGRSEHPLRNDPVGDVADGWSRADVRPSGLLQQIRWQSL